MNQIFWALAVVYLNQPISIHNVYITHSQCESIGKNFQTSLCYPVNVKDKNEALKQINAINIMITR